MDGGPAEEFRVRFDGVHLRRGERVVFDDLSCGFVRAQITVVLGGSGAGKTTMLRLIGGLSRPESGSVYVADEDVTQLSERELFRTRSRIGMLFQGGALLDSMTIFENVALPLREHSKLSEQDIAAEVQRRLDSVALPEAGPLYPRQLSGGMSRRAALARTIVTDPEIVLCDEPFSGLDPINVRRIEALLVDLNRRLGLTMIIASHHLASALRMASRIVFLVDGRAIAGTPQDLLRSTDHRVVEFLRADSDGPDEASQQAPAAASAGGA